MEIAASNGEEEDEPIEETRMLPEGPEEERDIESALDEAIEDPLEQAAKDMGERHAQTQKKRGNMNCQQAGGSRSPRKSEKPWSKRQLGHPSRRTLVRMLRLSGPVEAAVEHAKEWRCDVCASRAPPRHPAPSAPGTRRYGFNKAHQVDLKYIKDMRGKRYVFLSMLGVGTLYHQAVMLKTRQSAYVASKWQRHWLSQFGAPARITYDQGGEFESGFAAMLEEYSIASTLTGAHAGWQLSLAERHGGLLALILEAIIIEHQIEGFNQLKDALSAATAAKNQTVSRDGYTPSQRLFGQEVRFPGLTDDEERLSFAEAIGTEGEVARAHKLRLTARMALLRVHPAETCQEYRSIYAWDPSLLLVPKESAATLCLGNMAWASDHFGRPEEVLCFLEGRCLLLAEENLRLATGEELALQSPIPQQT